MSVTFTSPFTPAVAGAPQPWAEELVARAEGADLAPEQVFLAWELARLCETAAPEVQRALSLVVLALLRAQHDGSSRLDLREGGPLQRLLQDLAAPEDERRAVLDLAGRLRTQGPGADLAPVIGTGEAYVPLLLEGGRLYAQRLNVLEQRVAALLRERLAGGAVSTTAQTPGGAGSTTAQTAGGAVSTTAQTAGDGESAAAQATGGPVSTSAQVTGPEAAAIAAALRDIDARRPSGLPQGLAPAQAAAVAAAARRSLTVVTGGPGTGKTSIVVSMLRVIARLRGDASRVALAAPTGKAADRMARAIQWALSQIPSPADADLRLLAHPPEAVTLHRLLGYSPSADRFHHHEHHRLPAEVVILDESSMVDLSLMDRLLRALRPDARLVLLGDADQLPSVDAGAVFRDLCRAADAGASAAAASAAGAAAPGAAASAAAVELTESFRMDPADPAGRAILQVAQAVRDGRPAEAFSPSGNTLDPGAVRLTPDPASLDFERVHVVAPGTPQQREAFLTAWEQRRVLSLPESERLVTQVYRFADGAVVATDHTDLAAVSAHLEGARILCVVRGEAGGTGVDAVNRWFHQRALERVGLGADGRSGPSFGPGEPVLITRNDYRRGLFNGDQGVVLRGVLERGASMQLLAVFPRGETFAAFPVESLRGRLELAWATTVHKAQGSEYDHVALMLPDRDVRLLSREIVYTAITRARRSVTVVGDRERLVAAAGRPVQRDSGLAERLGEPAPPRSA